MLLKMTLLHLQFLAYRPCVVSPWISLYFDSLYTNFGSLDHYRVLLLLKMESVSFLHYAVICVVCLGGDGGTVIYHPMFVPRLNIPLRVIWQRH